MGYAAERENFIDLKKHTTYYYILQYVCTQIFNGFRVCLCVSIPEIPKIPEPEPLEAVTGRSADQGTITKFIMPFCFPALFASSFIFSEKLEREE